MGKRVISGALLLVAAVFFLYSGGALLACVLFLLGAVAYRELCSVMGVRGKERLNWLEAIGYPGAALYYGLLLGSGGREGLMFQGAFLLCIFGFMIYLAVYVFSFPRFRAEQVMSAFAAFLYGPVMLSFIYLTRSSEQGIYKVWMIFIASWVCDTCAYFAGVTLGRHKLAPVLSPKKSIEGAVGGTIGSALVGGLFAWVLLQAGAPVSASPVSFAVMGAVGAVISQIGDLAASAIKRNHGIKDYGNCIPGHGGVMDRFDSVIYTAPMVFLLGQLW